VEELESCLCRTNGRDLSTELDMTRASVDMIDGERAAET
jgi:hypothetical protein